MQDLQRSLTKTRCVDSVTRSDRNILNKTLKLALFGIIWAISKNF